MSFLTDLLRVDLFVYLIFIGLFIYWINGSKKKTANMPPGPKPWPLIGNLHLLDFKMMDRSFLELSEKYGEVYTVQLGSKPMVVISGYKAVKDALVNQAFDFGDRASTPASSLLNNQRGVLFSNGEAWKVMRRFTLATLRDFGMGKKTIEDKIQDEIIPLIEYFKAYHGRPFDTNIIMNGAVSNVICSILFGKRFEYDDQIFKNLLRIIGENNKLFGSPMVAFYNFYPRIGALLGAHKKLSRNIRCLAEFIINRIEQHKQEYDANNISGFIDAYIMKQKQESSKDGSYFDDQNLVATVMDLFDAGTDTTATTLRWGILLMAKYPEIQKKVQVEIQAHSKPGQFLSVNDRKSMPYTDAVIHELQRFANIVPLNGTHKTSNDVHFRGYFIKKDTDVTPLLTSVLYDKTQWKTPNQFNPNHFLDADGKFVLPDAFMPFSAGKRACAGEALAKMELFLFFTGLVKTFTFYPAPGVSKEELDIKPATGFILTPRPHMICARLNY